jgi:pimeloyl-ACP methyl ester carboxylesterase
MCQEIEESKEEGDNAMKKLTMLLAIGIAVGAVGLSFAHADSPWPDGCQVFTLPSQDSRYPEDQLALTCVPQNWNGQLVVYAHGYVPVQEPLALPIDDLVLSSGQTLPGILMSQGFAFATSSYHKNGYAIEQGGNDINNLVAYFKKHVAPGPIKDVYLVGGSEGGLIATMLLELHPEAYQGGLSLCGPVGGTPYQIEYLGDFRVVFDYFFPSIFPFDAAHVPQNAYFNWDNGYVPAVTKAITSHKKDTDQLFNVTEAARDPLDLKTSAVESALDILFFSIWGSNDLIDVAGGQPYGNLFSWYNGSANDFALNLRVERVRPSPVAVHYLERFYKTSGLLRRPLVTLHTTFDDVVPFDHELIYLKRVSDAGGRRFLTVLPVPRYGHCAFTDQEILGGFALLIKKSTGKVQPELEGFLLSISDLLGKMP